MWVAVVVEVLQMTLDEAVADCEIGNADYTIFWMSQKLRSDDLDQYRNHKCKGFKGLHFLVRRD